MRLVELKGWLSIGNNGNGQVPPGQMEDEDGNIVNPGGQRIDKPDMFQEVGYVLCVGTKF